MAHEQRIPDPVVLGQILLLQSVLHIAPDEEKMAEILMAGLVKVPGVRSAAICWRDKVISASPPDEKSCGDEPTSSLVSSQCAEARPLHGGSTERISIQGKIGQCGSVLLELSDENAFAIYRPFLTNTANLVGLLFESRQYEETLREVNKGLELQVARRTLALEKELAEHEAAEKALRKKTEELDRYFTYSLDLLCIATTAGIFQRVNPQWTKVLGYSIEELENRSAIDFIHPDDRASTEAALDRLKAQESVLNFINRYRAKDGNYRWVEWNALPAGDMIYAVARDITQRHLEEEEKEKTQAHLQKAAKMESIGTLAGGIAHDFNNFLTGLFGYLEMAQGQVDLGKSERAKETLKKALSSLERARHLTSQLLTFSKGGAPSTKTLKLESLIREATTFALSGSGVAVQIDTPPDLWNCDLDENQFIQAVDNLLRNAREAMEDRGVLTITARNICFHDANPSALPAGDYVRITIKDTGPGIAPEHMQRLFDPFFTTKSTGHGLGLPIVFSVVKKHGGTVEVESAAGEGATFHVFLPASKKSMEVLEVASNEPIRGHGRVLVMDDEKPVLEFARHALEEAGYEVDCAGNGEDAISVFKSKAPDVVVLDLTVRGGLGGIETLQELRKLSPSVKAVISSGYSDDRVISSPSFYGFKAFVSKPYRARQLAETVKKVQEDI